MKIFDFNIHLYSKETGELSDQLKKNTELTSADLINGFGKCKSRLNDSGLTSANFMLFNQKILDDNGLENFMNIVKADLPASTFTLLFDFRSGFVTDRLDKAKATGFKFIKFHSYTQQIADTDFASVLHAAAYAEKIGLGICIDASFGTTGLYKYDNLKLAACLAESIKKAPIILLHSGGSRVFDAMLIADLCPNVYFETSLSLDYYQGSTLLQDFAFAYKKIGLHRVLYASDYPYKRVDESIKDIEVLSKDYGFNETDLENILYHNAMNLINDL